MSAISLLDGGMGQELMKRSAHPPSPLWSAKVLMDEPELVEAVHRDNIDAGARVITLNAYSMTPERLARDGDINQFEALQAKAIDIAQTAARQSSDGIDIAGCLPPLVGSYRPEVTPDFDTCLKTYRRIVQVQKEGIDLFLCETLSSIKEVRAATTAAAESGKPVWTAMTVIDGNGLLLRSGETLADGILAAIDAGASAVLVNCSWPESIGQSMPVLASSGHPFGAFANGFTAIDSLGPGGTVDVLTARTDFTPAAYAEQVLTWVDAGATIVGGCCEVSPAHIAEISRQLTANGHEITGASL